MTPAIDTSGSRGAGSDAGMPPNCVPIVSTGTPSNAVAAAAPPTAISMPGQRGRSDFRPRMTATVASESPTANGVTLARAVQSAGSFSEQLARLVVQRQAEQVLDLTGEDDHGDAGGEADRHRKGDELDEGAEAKKARRNEQQTGQEGRQDQPVDAVLRHGRRHQHDERPGRPADLEPRAAERGDEKPAEDRGVEPLGRRRAGRDGDGHRQRQRDDGDGQPGDRVRPEMRQAIALAKDRDEFRGVELGEARRRAAPEWRGFHLVAGTFRRKAAADCQFRPGPRARKITSKHAKLCVKRNARSCNRPTKLLARYLGEFLAPCGKVLRQFSHAFSRSPRACRVRRT